jgi:type I restriction enzyme R subunit
VLAHEAYALTPILREERAQLARLYIHSRFTIMQQLFLDFVLQLGEQWRAGARPGQAGSPAADPRAESIADSVADFGKSEEIGQLFAGFQGYSYQPSS